MYYTGVRAVQDAHECVLCKIHSSACCSGYCFADGHERRLKTAASSQPLRPAAADARMAIAASQEQMCLQLQILADAELAATIRAGDHAWVGYM